MGEVTSTAAAETGLRPGPPVVVGGADTQLGLLGIGVTEPGRITVVGGTFWQTTVATDPPADRSRGPASHPVPCVPGQWMTEGIGFYCGIVMRWFRDAFCEPELLEAERGADAYDVMERKAATVPAGSNGAARCLLEPHGRQALGARVAVVRRVRRRRPPDDTGRIRASAPSRRAPPTSRAATCAIIEELTGPGSTM